MAVSYRNVSTWVLLLLGFVVFLDLSSFASASTGGSHKCNHGHEHHDHDHHHHHHHHESSSESTKLPEELAEEEDMKLYGFGFNEHDDHKHQPFGLLQLSGPGLWIHALGCSFLVSMASLICLIILPVIFIQGKPSKAIVDSLALFGAGAMLGDAFLHQLPHAFGGGHSHDHHEDHKHDHDHNHGNSDSHSHSLADLSVGLSVLAGIVIFLLVEKIVRYVEDNSGGSPSHGHHHHHHHSKSKKLKDDDDYLDDKQPKSPTTEDKQESQVELLDGAPSDLTKEDAKIGSQIRKRRTVNDGEDVVDATKSSSTDASALKEKLDEPPSSLVFGYLNLFSDGVHNFTDGMALGSAFLLYGTVGGWSRTLFLLAHEIPQEVGDFGILVRSGFSVSEALFFNFLSALVALAGTALALLWGRDPGQSSLIEGFTAGGFIYIAVAGVLAEMNSSGKTTVKSVAAQLTSLTLGMAVALCISLLE